MTSSVPINMKAAPEVRGLIDRAAQIMHRNRTEFMLDAAIQKAREVIIQQQLISLDEPDYDKFVASLDAPPAHNPRLQKLMAMSVPWES